MTATTGRRAAFAIVGVIVLVAALHLLGVGGYRNGELLVTAAMAAAATFAALVAIPRSVPMRWGWATAALAVGAVVGGLLAQQAPLSTGRLEARLDGLNLPDFEVLSTTRDGHSWCRPSCPTVTRVWRAPDTSPRAAVLTTVLSLAADGLAPPVEEIGQRAYAQEVRLEGDDVDIEVSAKRREPGDLRVRIVISSDR